MWRYMHVSKLLSLLGRSALFFARLDTLNDAYEGRFSEASIARFPSLQDFERFSNTLTVNCWCLAPADSALHWSAFCPGGFGVAIVSSYARLKKAFTRETGFRHGSLFITRVRYVDFATYMHVPEEGSPINPIATAVTKRLQFQAENEVRLVLFSSADPREQEPITLRGGTYVTLDLSQALDSVVCGPGTPSWLMEDLAEVFKRYGLPNVPVLRSQTDSCPERIGRSREHRS